jgi:hypothetical protein
MFILPLYAFVKMLMFKGKNVRCTLSWLEIGGESKRIEYFKILQNN